MIELGVTDFHLEVPSLPRDEFEQYSSNLFDTWDRFLAMELRLPDFGVRLELEEGSIKGRGRIVAAATMVWAGVISYGGFVQGVQAINATIRTSGRVLVDSAAEPFSMPEVIKRFRRDPGFTGKLERLFARVKSGELTPTQATELAIAMLQDEQEVPPELLDALTRSMHSVHIDPQQLTLPLTTDHDLDSPYAPEPRSPARPRSRPTLPPVDRVRIEIWRESKQGIKRVAVLED